MKVDQIFRIKPDQIEPLMPSGSDGITIITHVENPCKSYGKCDRKERFNCPGWSFGGTGIRIAYQKTNVCGHVLIPYIGDVADDTGR